MTSQASLPSESSISTSLFRSGALAIALTASPVIAAPEAANVFREQDAYRQAAHTTWSQFTEDLSNLRINPRVVLDDVAFDNPVATNSNDNQAVSMPHISHQAHERISYLQSLGDGWLGEDSVGATHEAWIEAVTLLTRIGISTPNQRLPSIGLTIDGEIIFTWNSNDLVGSLSIIGDGTYSFFVKKNGTAAMADDAKIIGPLPEELVAVLSL